VFTAGDLDGNCALLGSYIASSGHFIHTFWDNLSVTFQGVEDPGFLTFNPSTLNDPYSRTAPLTSKRCILYIYSTNTHTEYFKHGVCTLRFLSLQNAVCFIILTHLVPVLFTFYIQDVLKLKKNNSGTKRLIPLQAQNPLTFPTETVDTNPSHTRTLNAHTTREIVGFQLTAVQNLRTSRVICYHTHNTHRQAPDSLHP
jgi:hypothetical protein